MSLIILLLTFFHLLFPSKSYHEDVIKKYDHFQPNDLFSIQRSPDIYKYRGGYRTFANCLRLPVAFRSLLGFPTQTFIWKIREIFYHIHKHIIENSVRWKMISSQCIQSHLKSNQQQLQNYREDISQLRALLRSQSQHLRLEHANYIQQTTKVEKKLRAMIANLTFRIENSTYDAQGFESLLISQKKEIYDLKNNTMSQFHKWKYEYDLKYQRKIKSLNIKSKQKLENTIQMMKEDSNKVLQEHTNKYEELLVKERMRIHKLMKAIGKE